MRLKTLTHKLLLIAAFIVTLIAMHACNTSGCTDNQNALPLAGFYNSSDGKAISITDFDIQGVDAPNDSLLYSANATLSEIYLPFRSTKSSTAYIFTYHADSITTVSDRIEFTYSSEPYFASEECGAMYYYRITDLDYTDRLIDSVVITDSLITNANAQRIKIYFRTEESAEQ